MKNRRLHRWTAFLAAGVLALAVLAGCSSGTTEESGPAPQEGTRSVFPEGTSIGGKNISGKTTAEALEIARDALDEAMREMEITVRFQDDTVSLTRDDFVVTEELEAMLGKLLAQGKAEKYELSYVTDLSDAGKGKLQAAAEKCLVPAKNASVVKFDSNARAFVFSEGTKGSRVDMTKTLQSVRQLLSQKHGGAIQASFLETAPTLTQEKLSKSFRKLSSYSTESTNTSNGNSNMSLALSRVNGTVLQPGQEFSYNGTIGDSTDPSDGWLPAGGLMGGRTVQVYGGGICQGSTTLYGAALRAGMEIVERDCHSSPSTYCPIGLDATVDYGNIDFRFRNPLKMPVYIASWMDDVTLHVEFYGCFPEEWDRIEVDSEQTGSEPPLTSVRFEKDDKLKKGEYVKLSSGNTGYTARAWRIFYKGEKEVKREDLSNSYYEPTGATYAVGPDTDTSKVDTTKDEGTVDTSPSPSPSPTPSETPEGVTPEPSGNPEPGPGPTDGPDPTPSETPEQPTPTPPPIPDDNDIPDFGNGEDLISWD